MILLLKLFWSFLKIGAFTFGGGYAMIPLISKEIIDVHGWLTLQEFIDIIAIAEMTPGPIAINSATFVGYKIAGIMGSIASTVGVVLPSFLIIIAMVVALRRFWNSPLIQGSLAGIRSTVLALIVYAAFSIGRVAFTSLPDLLIAILVLFSLLRLKIHPILAIIGAGVLGVLKGILHI